MALSLQVVFLTVPSGTEFPGTMQELGDFLAQYLAISGGDAFSGVNYGDVEPTADNRDKPWFRLNDEGLPLGWYSWNGSSWVSIPVILPGGSTAQRPASPVTRQTYYDTSINAALIFNGSSWVTLAGSPGDTKFVKAANLATALVNNPGWSWDSESQGLVIAGASDGTSGPYIYASTTGDAGIEIQIENLPSSTIRMPSGVGYFPGAFQNGSQAPGIAPVVKGLSDAATISTGPLNGGVTQEQISVMQPTLFRWALVRD